MRHRLLLLAALLLASAAVPAQVRFEDLLRPDVAPGNWLSYSRSYDNQRHSPLRQITTRNTRRLQLE